MSGRIRVLTVRLSLTQDDEAAISEEEGYAGMRLSADHLADWCREHVRHALNETRERHPNAAPIEE